MNKLWKKNSAKLDPFIEAFTVGNDSQLDTLLFSYDIRASAAHARMLAKIGIMTKKECAAMLKALEETEKSFRAGKITLRAQEEDCHTVIENELTARLGRTGMKIHTGRSRNDQVLVAIRLFMKKELTHILEKTTVLAKQFLAQAKKNKDVPFPGYTHTQQAMLSNLGLYFGAFAESLKDDSNLLARIKDHIDKNPLGSAAGYGVKLPLDREMTTHELGFRKTQRNPMYCGNSRGKFESAVLEGLIQIMLTLSRFASDMLFFTSRECAYFKLSDTIVTGSSMMPQKRNLDPCEIIRGKTHAVIAHHSFVQSLTAGLISGYHRDLQLLKKPIMESFSIVEQSMQAASIVLQNIRPNLPVIREKIMPDIFAADQAVAMAKKGIPFRTAYQHAAKEIFAS